jgi:hypothetical protein
LYTSDQLPAVSFRQTKTPDAGTSGVDGWPLTAGAFLKLHDLGHLEPLGALGELELHLLALGQRLEAFS